MTDGNSGLFEAPVVPSIGRLYEVRALLGRSAILRSLPTTILISICIQAANLGSGIVLARALGPASRGNLAIAMLWPTLIAGIGGLGVAEAVTYLSGRNSARSDEVLNGSLVLGLLQSVALMGIGWLIVPHVLAGTASEVVDASLLYLLVIPLYPLTLYPLGFLQGRLLLGRFNIARICVHVIYTVALVALWAAQSVSIRSALIASLVATFVTCLITLWLVARRLEIRPSLSLSIIRALLAYGAKLHIGNVATLVTQRADLVALSVMAPAAVLGNYVVASSIGLGAALIPSAVSMVLFPIFSNQEKDSVPRGLARFLLAASGVTMIAGPVLAVALPWTLPYLFGSAFAAARATATVLVLAYLVRGWSQMVTAILRGTGAPFLASAGELIGLIVTAALLIRLVPGNGAYGAAIAVLAGASAALMWVLVQSFRTSRLTAPRMLSYWSADTIKFVRLVRKHPAAGV